MLLTLNERTAIRAISPVLEQELDRILGCISQTFTTEHTEQGFHNPNSLTPVSVQAEIDSLQAQINAISFDIGSAIASATPGSVLFASDIRKLAQAVGFIYDDIGSLGSLASPSTLYVGKGSLGTDGQIALWDSGLATWQPLAIISGNLGIGGSISAGSQISSALGDFSGTVRAQGGLTLFDDAVLTGDASADFATLVGGTVTVNTTKANGAHSIIHLTRKVTGGTAGTLTYTVVDGVSFTINSSSILDTSTVAWSITQIYH